MAISREHYEQIADHIKFYAERMVKARDRGDFDAVKHWGKRVSEMYKERDRLILMDEEGPIA